MENGKNIKTSTWPLIPYMIAWIWAAFALLGVVILDGVNRMPFHSVFLALMFARFLWARIRKERNRGWIFYIILLAVSPWFLLIVEYIVCDRKLFIF